MKGNAIGLDAAPRPPLPSDHVFVVQFRARSRGDRLAAGGRVEHLRSGEATHFESPAELLAFTRRLLSRACRKTAADRGFDSEPRLSGARANHGATQRSGKSRP